MHSRPATPRSWCFRPSAWARRRMGEIYEVLDEKTSIATVEQALASGVRIFDTSPHYGNGIAESRMGAGLRRAKRSDVIVSTKIGRVMDPFAKPAAAQQGRVLAGVRRRLWACAALRLFVRRHDALGRAIAAAHRPECNRHPAHPRLRRLDARRRGRAPLQGSDGRRLPRARQVAQREDRGGHRVRHQRGRHLRQVRARRRLRRRDDGRALLAADPERHDRIPAAGPREEDGRHAGGRLQLRNPRHRRCAWRQVRIRGGTARDHGAGAQDRGDLRDPRHVRSGAPRCSSRCCTRRSSRSCSAR